ncbi:DUF4190 domain-containing protein [Alteribacillus iranensis]|uniref:DUF4190 domain-containing protein n=1 Tax=Alteribacillus iranensis TaxID=930128 RepID=A0A1I1ZCN3_9BACI|nr:DUF4190 domain-containing protein [Alteribacillus iranensis]SFE29584.1 hypothetical protein SAMN05192532_101171 [Alteribacillus iranensis]
MDEFEKRSREENESRLTDEPRAEETLADAYDVEAASEIATPGVGERHTRDEERNEIETDTGDESMGRGIGIAAIVLSICSLFFLPIITGAAGIILGILAIRRETRGMGYSAIVIGAISIMMTLFFNPFM